MGTIITALRKARPIVLLPRKGSLKETRNDHQIATVNRFRSKAGVYVADEETDINDALGRALGEHSEMRKASDFASEELTEAIKDFINK